MTTMALQDLPLKFYFRYQGELYSNGYRRLRKDDFSARLRGEPWCILVCARCLYNTLIDLPGEILVEPVSVTVGAYDVAFEEYKQKYMQ